MTRWKLSPVKSLAVLAAALVLPTIVMAQSSTASQGMSAGELEVASQLSEKISTSEWLGPLAPVALSPYFGMACLAGIAQFGPESMVAENGFLSADTPLRNPYVFCVFAILAFVTSLPRLTKVSKPIAGALEQLESYSSIIALVAIRFLAGNPGEAIPGDGGEVVFSAGIGDLGADALLSIAAAVNIVVVNAVKFFFEFLIWLTPIPTVDALFEAANKVIAGALMSLYAFSPFVASIVNGVIFAICLVLFIWTRRQVVFLRTMLVGWTLSWISKGKPPTVPEIVVFPKESIGPFPARERLVLSRTQDGFVLSKTSLFGRRIEHVVEPTTDARIEPGWIANAVVVSDDEECCPLLLSRRQTVHLELISALLHLRVAEPEDGLPKRAASDELGRAKPATA